MGVKDIALTDLWDELLRGKVYELSLRNPKWHLDGLQEGENVYIDPRYSILETLTHELIHRRYPHLGERTVQKLARRLTGSMDEETKVKWFSQYIKIRKKGRPKDTSAP